MGKDVASHMLSFLRHLSIPSGYATLLPISYTVEPHLDQYHCDFVKQSKNGGFSLHLTGQERGATQPVYGRGGPIEGTVNVWKPEGISSVEVKIEGKLVLKEIAASGSAISALCLSTMLLWARDELPGSSCPPFLPFCLKLPTAFTINHVVYPLPPTYEAHLSGLPGFQADIHYFMSATITKPKSALSRVRTVSTPFIYRHRTRPSVPLPSPMVLSREGMPQSSEWRLYQATIRARSPGGQDVVSQLYLPRSGVFCLKQAIPFHLVFKSSAYSLAMFLPYGPDVNGISLAKRAMRLQLLRQCIVDVQHNTNALELGIKTDIWRVDNIGEGSFVRSGDGPRWAAFSGEIKISDKTTVGGFKAGGLTVKDFIVLSMYPLDITKSPFNELRQVVPVRLATDAWMPDDEDLQSQWYEGSECSWQQEGDKDEFETSFIHFGYAQ